jgi:phage I-like protein
MASCMFIADAPELVLSSDPAVAVPSRVQIAKTGSFYDRRYGKFSITHKDFEKWLDNFERFAKANGRPGLPVDVDHGPERRGQTEAVGWVTALAAQGDELWATVQWNSKGRELVSDQRYAFLSPSYKDDFVDEQGKSHGTALIGVGLTNRPFLTMATVTLSMAMDAQAAGAWELDDELSDEDVFVLSPLTTKRRNDLPASAFVFPAERRYPIHDIAHARNALARASGKPEEAKVKAAVHKRYPELGKGDDSDKKHSSDSPPQMPELTQIAKALGLAEDADEAAILDALASKSDETRTLDQMAKAEGKMLISADEYTTLSSNAAAGRQAHEELRVTRFETAFDKALDEGRTTPAQKDGLRSFYDLDADKALAHLDTLPQQVNVRATGGTGGGAQTAQLGAGDVADPLDHYDIDTDQLALHAKVTTLAAEQNIDYASALERVEAMGGAS